MTNEVLFKKTMELVRNKMGNKSSCQIDHKPSGREFFFSRGTDGYTLYKGCDLVIGDCGLDQCVAVMIGICAS